jgi:hypothetical protein
LDVARVEVFVTAPATKEANLDDSKEWRGVLPNLPGRRRNW